MADAKAGDGVARAWLSKVLGIDSRQQIDNVPSDAFLSRETLYAKVRQRIDELTAAANGVSENGRE